MPEINHHAKMLHIQAINRLRDDMVLHIIDNNTIESTSRGYEIKDNTTGEMKTYKVTLTIKEVEKNED